MFYVLYAIAAVLTICKLITPPLVTVSWFWIALVWAIPTVLIGLFWAFMLVLALASTDWR